MKEDEESRQLRLAGLLSWCSKLSGLPITDICQCQNGAVFCIITAIACSPNDVLLGEVNFEARTEHECRANYTILQHLAKSGRINGLNKDAGLASWMRMSQSRADAQHYLKLLHRTLKKLKTDISIEFEPEATAPPAPCFDCDQGHKQRDTWWTGRKTSDSGAFAPSDFGYRLPSGSLELELTQSGSMEAEGSLSPTSIFSHESDGPDFSAFARKNSLYVGSDSEDSLSFKGERLEKLQSTSSSTSQLEAFMFPDNKNSIKELIQQSLEKQEEEDFFCRMESVDPFNTSIFSTMSSWNNMDEFRFGRRQNSHNSHSGHISDMIKDLDLMISELDGEREELLHSALLQSGSSSKVPNFPSMTWDDA